MPSACNDDEEHEDQDLQDESAEDDVLAKFDAVVVLGLHQHTSTTALYEETQNVSSHEDFSNPIGAYDRVGGRVGAQDQTSENHVDGRSEQNRSDEDKDGLNNVRRFGDGVIVCCSTSTVSDGLELRKKSAEVLKVQKCDVPKHQ